MIPLAFFFLLLYLYFVWFFDEKKHLTESFLGAYENQFMHEFGASPMFPPCYITGGFSTNQQNASVGNMYPPSC